MLATLPAGAFPHARDPLIRHVIALWLGWRGARRMPARTDVDPVGLDGALPVVWLCDYERSAGRFRCRLAGDRIDILYGGRVAGRHLDDFVPSDRIAEVLGRYNRVVTEPAIGHAAGRVYLERGRRLVGERILLPLAADGRTPDAVLGATSFRWPAGVRMDEARGELLRLTFTPI